uniref:Protein kinase domain-containing protein n=1 Tax=Chromera velia CCMP2878 TaxID=1169474 RepID=A0A0G4FHC3_9ALVE|eukprot:Cvel_16847.t1-p1 / transcript=Cvel_16847.t1 / gene=Cvel_16847 / organism=Chromera_velia_CCMP2878 / gene_product=3-phosphoinositide-dependent protein kinase 1, putative / transcript_product=3-phosphoinositide-dependent protein kinase 1, putative / location=Cvel_scaffold1317:31978-36232(-) / protein_length=527 / sequence_SO=supercontig / SO=protein_coding / is_pseudo=false
MMKKGFLQSSSSKESKLSGKLPSAPPLAANGKPTADHFVIERLVGQGNFSEVLHVTEKGTGNEFAMKVMEKQKVERHHKQRDVLMEKHVLTKLNEPGHPHVVRLFQTFKDDSTGGLYFILEYCGGGEVWEMVRRVGTLDVPSLRVWAAQTVSALGYLHSRNVVHRDLKCENLMLTDEGAIKLIDFGTALDADRPDLEGAGNRAGQKTFSHYVGSANFMAPEAIQNKGNDFRSDLWALGCTLFQMASGEPPFEANSEYLVYLKSMEGEKNLTFPFGFPPLLEDLVRRLVKVDPDDRLSLAEVKRHPFFEGLDVDNPPRDRPPVPPLWSICLKSLAVTRQPERVNREAAEGGREAFRRGAEVRKPETLHGIQRLRSRFGRDIRREVGDGVGALKAAIEGETPPSAPPEGVTPTISTLLEGAPVSLAPGEDPPQAAEDGENSLAARSSLGGRESEKALEVSRRLIWLRELVDDGFLSLEEENPLAGLAEAAGGDGEEDADSDDDLSESSKGSMEKETKMYDSPKGDKQKD